MEDVDLEASTVVGAQGSVASVPGCLWAKLWALSLPCVVGNGAPVVIGTGGRLPYLAWTYSGP